MAYIEMQQVAHSYLPKTQKPEEYALKNIHLSWEDGGAYALLGPSGCGKTTLLNVISGLITPTQGRVLFNGNDITTFTPEKRNIAQVFQFPVLYDTMTVFDNLAFPLRNRGVPEDQVRKRVGEVGEMLDLATSFNKRAAGLSADAKQKISLGRGLVRSDVAAVLFDEPLTVIDPHLKWHLRRKLKEIHEQFNITMIYVTHDQVEAMTFADTVVVMYEGEIVQVGTPADLYERPEHKFVGYFIGSPGMNFVPCTLDGSLARVDGGAIRLDDAIAHKARAGAGSLELGIRPLHLELHHEAREGWLPATVKNVEDLGGFRIVTLELAGHRLMARLPEQLGIPQERTWLRFPPEKTRLYADGRLLG